MPDTLRSLTTIVLIYFGLAFSPGCDAFHVATITLTSYTQCQSTTTPWSIEFASKRRLLCLRTSLSSTDKGDIITEQSDMVKSRKQRVLNSYRLTATSYLLAVCVALKKAGSSSKLPFVAYTVAGPLMASGMAHNLAKATIRDKLPTATSKRLNLGLVIYGIINLLLAAISAQFTNPIWYCWAFLAFITTSNSIKGYGYGVKGWTLKDHTVMLAKNDLQKGIKENFNALTSIQPNLQSLVYLATTLTLGTLSILKLADILRAISSTGAASELSSFAKLWLLTIASLTLKIGADRGGLEGMTMIQLNCLLSYAFGAMTGACTYDPQACNRNLLYCVSNAGLFPPLLCCRLPR